MPEFFEIFGYPLSDQSEEAKSNRLAAQCPFMGRDCDGGGNRYLSQIQLTANHSLKSSYPNREALAAGVCSIQVARSAAPWIVCPRRLLVLGRERAGERVHQKSSEAKTLTTLGYPSGTKLGVWPEVKMKYVTDVDGVEVSIDYSFDYILMPLAQVSQLEVEAITGLSWIQARRNFESGGYTIAKRGEEYFIEDCPIGAPSVIEIMTSSTSGGNKNRRSTIPMAFEDAMLGKPHLGATGEKISGFICFLILINYEKQK